MEFNYRQGSPSTAEIDDLARNGLTIDALRATQDRSNNAAAVSLGGGKLRNFVFGTAAERGAEPGWCSVKRSRLTAYI